jgi:hypothetical protein
MWRSLADTFRDCGRNATLFVVVVLALGAAAFAGGEACLWTALAVIVAVALRVIWGALHPPARRWQYAKLPPLSQNEWRAARTKLTATQDLSRRRLLSKSGRMEFRPGPKPMRRPR